MPTQKALYNAPTINSYPEEKGRRITGLNGKFAIAVQDTGFLMIRANAPTNNYRIKEKVWGTGHSSLGKNNKTLN